jgi:hypothetical protein
MLIEKGNIAAASFPLTATALERGIRLWLDAARVVESMEGANGVPRGWDCGTRYLEDVATVILGTREEAADADSRH